MILAIESSRERPQISWVHTHTHTHTVSLSFEAISFCHPGHLVFLQVKWLHGQVKPPQSEAFLKTCVNRSVRIVILDIIIIRIIWIDLCPALCE